MLEDEIYRSSSQYRLWSFTAASLRATREQTNKSASARTRAAIQRKREDAAAARAQAQAQAGEDAATTAGTPPASEAPGAKIECLTVEEEVELTDYYCVKIMQLGDQYNPPLPTQVLATAIQYFRRFYLSNSPMIYHPRDIMPCCLFLATKTENCFISLRAFTERLSMNPDAVIAPEFLLTQGLRFIFDIRHPFRGLEGAMAELTAIARADALPGPHLADSPTTVKSAIHALPPSDPNESSISISIYDRFARAHRTTRDILKTAAQCTDVYFLFTPAQIWLAALTLADARLAAFYLDVKMGTAEWSRARQLDSNDNNGQGGDDPQAAVLKGLRDKVGAVVGKCAAVMQGYREARQGGGQDVAGAAREREKRIKAIGKKLYYCQNPEKSDLIAMNRKNRAGQGQT